MSCTLTLPRTLLVQLLRWLVNLQRYGECWFAAKTWHCYTISKWFDCTATLSGRLDDRISLALNAAQLLAATWCTPRYGIDLLQTAEALTQLVDTKHAADKARVCPPRDGVDSKKRDKQMMAALRQLAKEFDAEQVVWSFAPTGHRLKLCGDSGGTAELLYVHLHQSQLDPAARPATTLLELVVPTAWLHRALKVETEADDKLTEINDGHTEPKLRFDPNRPDIELCYSRQPVAPQRPDGGAKPQTKRQALITTLFSRNAAATAAEPTRRVKLTLNGNDSRDGFYTPGDAEPSRPPLMGTGELRVINDSLPPYTDDLVLRYGHHTMHQLLRAHNLHNVANMRWQQYEGDDDPLLVLTLLRHGVELARCCVAQGNGDEDLVVLP